MESKRTEWITALTECITVSETNTDVDRLTLTFALYRLLPHLTEIRDHLLTSSPTDPPELSQRLAGRADEQGFRRLAPRYVFDREIVTIGRFIPGDANYASALVITIKKGRYATHRLVCQDDNRSGALTWYLINGNYDLETLSEAQADLERRRRL